MQLCDAQERVAVWEVMRVMLKSGYSESLIERALAQDIGYRRLCTAGLQSVREILELIRLRC